MIKSICREFGVDYGWFTNGVGKMFPDSGHDHIALIDRVMTGENEFAKNIFKTLSEFDEEHWLTLERIIDKYLEISKKIDSI